MVEAVKHCKSKSYTSTSNISFITSRAILTTKTDFIDEINDNVIYCWWWNSRSERAKWIWRLYAYFKPPGLPPYKLSLKKYCPIILLRNLNPSVGMCNGTRLTCDDFKSHIISIIISNGDFKDIHVFSLLQRMWMRTCC